MTEATTGQNTAGQPSVTLGARLRGRRMERGWSLEQVESHLKMRRATLQAIEGERYSELPDKVYALGFIKSYAHFLELDVASIMEQAERELASFVPKRQTVQVELPSPHEGRSAGLWGLLGVGLVVIIGGYAGWYHFYSHGELASSLLPAHVADGHDAQPVDHKEGGTVATSSGETSTGSVAGDQTASLPQVTAPSTTQDEGPKQDDAAKDTPDLAPAPEVISPGAEPNNVAGDHMGGQDAAHPSLEKGQAAESSGPVVPAPMPSVQSQDVTQPPPSSSAQQAVQSPAAPVQAQPAASSDENTVAIVAHEDSWVQISDATGKVLVSRLLKPGETWQGTAGASYRITCGNAGGVVFQTGNVVSAPLGQRGRVVRNLVVDATAVTQGRYGYGSVITGAAPTPEGH